MTTGTTRGIPSRTPEHRTPAQVRVGAIHAYDLRGLRAEESAEALANIERLLKEQLTWEGGAG